MNTRTFFNGTIIPKPVITTQGLCFAINARDMKDVFSKNIYIEKFESIFGGIAPENILNGRKQKVKLEVNMQSKYLDNRARESGNFWYGKVQFSVSCKLKLTLFYPTFLNNLVMIEPSKVICKSNINHFFLGLELTHQACFLI